MLYYPHVAAHPVLPSSSSAYFVHKFTHKSCPNLDSPLHLHQRLPQLLPLHLSRRRPGLPRLLPHHHRRRHPPPRHRPRPPRLRIPPLIVCAFFAQLSPHCRYFLPSLSQRGRAGDGVPHNRPSLESKAPGSRPIRDQGEIASRAAARPIVFYLLYPC